MKNSHLDTLLQHCTKSSSFELNELIKEITISPSVNQIESNLSIFGNLIKEFKKSFSKEKCELCYLFTLFSYHLTENSNAEYFSKIFLNYALLFYEKNIFSSSFTVVYLYIKYQHKKKIFSFQECLLQYKNIIDQYENNKIPFLSTIQLKDMISYEKGYNYLFILLQIFCNFTSLEEAEFFYHFIRKNSLELKTLYYDDKNKNNNNYYCDNYFKIITRFIQKCFMLLVDDAKSLSCKEKYFTFIIDILSEYCSNYLSEVNVKIPFERILIFFEIVVIKSSALISKNIQLRNISEIDKFISCAVKFFQRYDFKLNELFDLDENKKQKGNLQLKYSHFLGKVQNLYSNINDQDKVNKYSFEILKFYKKYKIVTVDLLLVKINYFKAFVNDMLYNKEVISKEKEDGYLKIFHENIKEIFVLFSNCIIETDEDKEIIRSLEVFLNTILESSILGYIQSKGNFQFEMFIFIINDIFNYKGALLKKIPKKKDEDFFFNLIKLVINKEDMDTLNKMISSFNGNEKKLQNYFYILSFFMVNKKEYFRMKIIIQILYEYKEQKHFISFINKVILFCLKTLSSDKIDEIDSKQVEFIFDILALLVNFFQSKITPSSSSFEQIRVILEQFIFPNLMIYCTDAFKYILDTAITKNKGKTSIPNDVLNTQIKFLQKICYYIELFKELFIGFINNSEHIGQYDFFNFHISLIFIFFDKLIAFNRENIILFINNPTVLKSFFQNKPIKLKLVFYILIALIKNNSEKNILKGIKEYECTYKDLDQTLYDFKNFIDVFNDVIVIDNTTTSKKKKNSVILFTIDNLLSYDINIEAIEESKKFLSVNNSINIQSKIDFVYGNIIIMETFKKFLFFGVKEQTKILEMSNLIENNIQFLQSYDSKENNILIASLLLFESIINNIPILENDDSNINILSELFDFPPSYNQFNYLIEKITIVKLISSYFSLFDEKNNHMMPIIKSLDKEYKDLEKIKEKTNLTLVQYIEFIDLKYYEFFLSLRKSVDINVLYILDKGKNLLDEMILLYKALIQKKNKMKFSEYEQFKVKIIYSYLLNHKLPNNNNLFLLNLIDYQFIIIDILDKIIQVSNIVIVKMITFGFCDDALKIIHSFNKIVLLKYNNKYMNDILTYQIKISRKYERKNLYSIFQDDFAFKSLEDFRSWDNKTFIAYLFLNHPSLNQIKDGIEIEKFNAIDIIHNNKINNDRIVSKYYGTTYGNLSNQKNTKKEIALMIKNNISINKEGIETEFKRYYNINPNNAIAFYLARFTDVQYKYEIKLIPYIFYEVFEQQILNVNAIHLIIGITKDIIENNTQMQWSNYTKIKHLKKVIKELVYFTSISESEDISIELIHFYIKYLLNFKYNIEYTKNANNNKLDSDDHINYISTFRIRHYFYFCVKIKGNFAYNKIDLHEEKNTHIFQELAKVLKSYDTENKIVSGANLRNVDSNLQTILFELQNLLIFSSNNICSLLKGYLSENMNFKEYINIKIKKYKEKFHLSFKETDPIDWIVGIVDLNINIKKNSKQPTKAKNKIELSNIPQENSSKFLKNRFIKKYYFSTKFKVSLYEQKQSHSSLLFYIPCGELSKLPIENLPIFFHLPIIRTSSYSYINKTLILMEYNIPFSSITYILNPSGDLSSSEKMIDPFLKKYHINGFQSKEPQEKKLISSLTQTKLFIYCGHGDATKYIHLDYIKKNQINFMAFLFGCSSSNIRMITGKDSQPFGLPHYYLFNGCPFFLGFLWTVTSKDIDSFMINLFETIFNENRKGKRISLIESILLSKKTIKHRNLNGRALVFYGNNDYNMSVY